MRLNDQFEDLLLAFDMIQFIVLTLLLMSFSDEIGAIQCYTGENTGPSQNAKDCSDKVTQCKKEIREHHDDSLPTINYYCGGSDNIEQCEIIDGSNLKKTVCTCTGNLCNQAHSVAFFLPLITFNIFVAYG